MKNVLKKLAVCMIAMAMLVTVRAVFAPDVSAKAGDSSDSSNSYYIWYCDGTTTVIDVGTYPVGSIHTLKYATKKGYTAFSWNTKSDGTGTSYSYSDIYYGSPAAGDIVVLYAEWTPNKFYIVLDGNGSTSGSYTTTYVGYTGSTCQLPANVYAREGYAFSGWNMAADGSGTDIGDQGYFTYTPATYGENFTLYAQWTPYTFQLVLDGNGSTSGSYSEEYWGITGGNYALPANVYTRTGYTFTGWNTQKNGTGTSFSDGEVVSATPSYDGATITLYAQWTKDTSAEETSYSISYVLDGGTNNSANPSSYTGSSAVSLKDPTRTGYTFGGWYTDSAFKTRISTIEEGSTGNLTLYAKWTKNTSSQDSSTSQGSGTSQDSGSSQGSGTSQDSSTSQDSGTSQDSSTSQGSGTSQDSGTSQGSGSSQSSSSNQGSGSSQSSSSNQGSGSSQSSGSNQESGSKPSSSTSQNSNSSQQSSSSQQSDSTQKQTVYTIKFNGNGSTSGSMADMTKCKYNSSYTLSKNEFKRTGYTFAGWNTKKDGSGTSYKNKASVKKLTSKSNGTVTLYAQWTVNKYTIIFNGNGSTSGSMSDLADCRYTSSYKLTANKFKKTGYTFAGWNTKKDGSGTSYKNKAKVKKLTAKNKGTVTLYAQWTLNQYTITFDGNGSTSGSMSDLTDCRYTSSYKLNANKFKKTGYTFAGWNTKKDGSGTSYKNKAKVKKLTAKNKGTVTLYAQWTAVTYSIKYVLNGGTNSDSNPSSYTYGNAVTLKDPTRSGYTFLGWYTDKNLTESITKISAKASGKLTLYAGWKKTKTTCTTCGGSGTVPCGTCGGSKTTETKCDTCYGLGYIVIAGQGAEVCGICDGTGTLSEECTTCNGKGEVTCSSCGGTGTK